jgi:raffinose/stachyose/melibiose transport system permease protein
MSFSTVRGRSARSATGRLVLSGGTGLILIGIAIVFLFPMVWMAVSAFKSNSEIYRNTWGLPESWHPENFVAAWNAGVGNYILNSIIVTLASVVGVLIVATLASYALVRLPIPFAGTATLVVILGMLFPPTVALVPLATLFQNLHLQDNLAGIILLYIAFQTPFMTFLISTYMATLPVEIEEAARIDGANTFQILTRLIVPLCVPILISAGLLQFMWAWNEFPFALLLLDSESNKTLAVGLTGLQGRTMTNFPLLLAGMTIATLPVVVAFMIGQRRFIAGLAAGAGK